MYDAIMHYDCLAPAVSENSLPLSRTQTQGEQNPWL